MSAAEKKSDGSGGAAAESGAAPRSGKEAVPQLELHNLHPPAGAVKDRLRRGQGPGSGRGRQAGRGHKGQKSRSGYSSARGFEGGQMPLHRRLPKRGFTNIFGKDTACVNLERLGAFEAGETVSPEVLLRRGIIKSVKDGVKILGRGTVDKPLTVKAHAFSVSARQKIEAAGGVAEVIER